MTTGTLFSRLWGRLSSLPVLRTFQSGVPTSDSNGFPGASRADILVCRFTGLSSPVFPAGDWNGFPSPPRVGFPKQDVRFAKRGVARTGRLESLPYIALLAAATVAHGQSLTITGLTAETAYNDSVTFTVQTQAGFSYVALLDAAEVPGGAPVTVSKVDYHELQVFRTNQSTLAVTNRLIQFIVRSSERGETEDGIPPWTPYPPIPSTSNELAVAHLKVIAPLNFPAGYEVPIVAWIENDQGHAVRANGALSAPGQPSIDLRRGVGSGFLGATNPAGLLAYTPHVRQLTSSNGINLETNTAWTSVSGTLSGATVWAANSRIGVTGNITIPFGSTLTIGEGAIVRLNSGVDVTLNGQLILNGTTNQPVVFMPVSRAQPWGGFILQGTAQVTGSGAIFTGSGAVQNWFGTGGHPNSHRKEQALFYCTNSPALSLTDCAAIYLAGQLGHSVNGGTLTLTRFLMQRTTSGGEFTSAAFRVNDSAFIDCPDDSADFVDGDNDGIYIVNGTHGFTNTLFGWVKDDGVDSGESGSGRLDFQNCWFESTFHEGNSLSGTGKIVNHFDDVFINCGQGLEAGYSGPTGTLGHSLVTGNLVGGRFGDNYLSQSYSGFLRATNSLLLFNYRDVWGMNWQDWTYRTAAMDVHSNFVGAPNPFHPNNMVWQSTDGWRLAAFMTTPPDADVGIGIATRGSQFDFTAMPGGVPVRLSSFTTNAVTVNYTVQTPGQPGSAGMIGFQPGETVKFIPFSAPSNGGPIQVRITDPVRAVITGIDAVYFASNPAPLVAAGSVWRYLDTGEDAGTAWRTNGFNDSAWLSGPAELGYGDGDEATLVRSNGVNGRIITTYFRRSFDVPDPAIYSSLTVSLRRDDGGVVYLNGTEVFRSNMTNGPSVPVTYTNFAGGSIGSETAYFSTNVAAALLQSGTNVVAAEIHQNSLTSTDVSFELKLDGALKPVLLSGRFGDDWLLLWTSPTAVLEQADTVAGPWADVPSGSPVKIDFSSAQRFYRLRGP